MRPLAVEADPGVGVTYSEAVAWVEWLVLFTPRDLAGVMAVPVEIAENALRALQFHGVVRSTGDVLQDEPIFEYRTVAYPLDPKRRPRKPPEWVTCERDLVPPDRGLPIRLVNEDRRAMSIPGQRHRIVQREKRYKQMMAAKERRREQMRRRVLTGLV